MPKYDDSYPTCITTSATLRIASDGMSPDEISKHLELTPTSTRIKGEMRVVGKPKTVNRINVWFLESEKAVQSKDTRRHIDWIVSSLDGKGRAIEELRSHGADFYVFCTWESSGQGGPMLDPEQMEGLSKLGLSIGWEVWFPGDE